ncbi:hypothetical protein NBM05_12875 [Rothia sp. AR01]|uniref:Uncharacterized protein n=1 Tax=Rothia santali TaxID=2949643 RepID=A0A9X2HGE1_9MICC|nr:hypothetical protein [Rothia santali]MCP3426874.1 hypothetical protein [Rothia santali]
MLEEIPGIDPEAFWSENSLREVEKCLVRRFSGIDEMPAETFEEYQMYVGEGLRRLFDGRWMSLPSELIDEEGPPGRGISYDRMDHVDVTDGMIHWAMSERSGTCWATLFGSNRNMMPD